jgi:hypothetical protein
MKTKIKKRRKKKKRKQSRWMVTAVEFNYLRKEIFIYLFDRVQNTSVMYYNEINCFLIN